MSDILDFLFQILQYIALYVYLVQKHLLTIISLVILYYVATTVCRDLWNKNWKKIDRFTK